MTFFDRLLGAVIERYGDVLFYSFAAGILIFAGILIGAAL